MKNEKEFAALVRAHKSTIYTVCYLFAKQQQEADDLFQEVLINLWRGYADFRGESALKSWIWRVSLNTCLSAERKQRRRFDSREVRVNLYEASDTESRQIRRLHDRIHALPPFDRAIVLLWLENISYEEIGAIVGITPKQVSVRLYRIKEQLKKM